MANVSDKEIALARVYAGSMLELAEAGGEADSLLQQLLDLAAYLDKNPDFDAFFSSPMLDPAAREKTIEKLFRGKAGDLLVDSLQVLNRKGRLALFRSVVEAYRLAHEELRGLVEVHVRTAVPLTGKARKRLNEVASRHTGMEAMLVETVDEAIIGGMIIRIGDEKCDTSVASRLKKMGDALRERASRELHGGKTFVAGTAG